MALSQALMVRVAERLRVLGQPVRLRLVEHLMRGESTPQDLSDALGLSQQNVSKHLLMLHRAGIVSRRPEGASVWYALRDDGAVVVFEQTVESVRGQLRELSCLAMEDDGGDDQAMGSQATLKRTFARDDDAKY